MIYKIKPLKIEAERFTQTMYTDLLTTAVDPKQNPIRVKLLFFPDCEAYWNWHTAELSIRSEDAMMIQVVKPGDFIIRIENNRFTICREEVFLKTYDEVPE